jgi:RNA polymerase sigma-70 factor (ECF subfamily)
LIKQKEIYKNLLNSAKKGDIDAFEKILLLYEKAIFNHIYRIVSNKKDAEDLTQETFIRLYEKRSLINPDKNFKSWLYKIATNIALDFLRKKTRQKELFLIDSDQEPFETIDEEDSYYRIERTYDLERALSKLKLIHKTVLLLFYRDDFDYEAIAKTLDVPINTVKTHLYRAKKELKEILEKNE